MISIASSYPEVSEDIFSKKGDTFTQVNYRHTHRTAGTRDSAGKIKALIIKAIGHDINQNV